MALRTRGTARRRALSLRDALASPALAALIEGAILLWTSQGE